MLKPEGGRCSRLLSGGQTLKRIPAEDHAQKSDSVLLGHAGALSYDCPLRCFCLITRVVQTLRRTRGLALAALVGRGHCCTRYHSAGTHVLHVWEGTRDKTAVHDATLVLSSIHTVDTSSKWGALDIAEPCYWNYACVCSPGYRYLSEPSLALVLHVTSWSAADSLANRMCIRKTYRDETCPTCRHLGLAYRVPSLNIPLLVRIFPVFPLRGLSYVNICTRLPGRSGSFFFLFVTSFRSVGRIVSTGCRYRRTSIHTCLPGGPSRQ